MMSPVRCERWEECEATDCRHKTKHKIFAYLRAADCANFDTWCSKNGSPDLDRPVKCIPIPEESP